MLNAHTERFMEAAKEGEILTVIYSGGHHPGSKRKILPIRIAGHLLYARSQSTLTVQTYRLDGLSIVQDDFSAPWIDDISQGGHPTTIIDDPVIYFQSWKYLVHKALWPALGVSLREYVDKEKAKVLKAEAKRLGQKYVAPLYLAYARTDPPVFDFQEGDLFFSSQNSSRALQVIARRKLLEVHQIFLHEEPKDEGSSSSRLAYQLIDGEFAEWLRTGLVPAYAQIDAAKSYSDVLRFSIALPLPGIEPTS